MSLILGDKRHLEQLPDHPARAQHLQAGIPSGYPGQVRHQGAPRGLLLHPEDTDRLPGEELFPFLTFSTQLFKFGSTDSSSISLQQGRPSWASWYQPVAKEGGVR